ncbi:MAG TPA: nucleotidyltransferase family protein [Nevskiaceae bacterium]|nr:nucleotidyltransferase family protein [Nevskiaceae bacterium]
MIPRTVLILAGSRPSGDPLAEYAGVSHKALIDVGGQPMLLRVVQAVTALPEVERILIAIDQPEILHQLDLQAMLPRPILIERVATAAGPSATVASVLASSGAPLLITTADHALLEPEWITDFLERVPPDCDVAALLAPRAAVLGALPQTQRTFLRFADGAWSGCNLFLLATPAATAVVRFWQSIEAERKHPLRLVRRLGLSFALRYELGLLTLDAALQRMGRLCGARLAVVQSPFGLAAVDVDKPADLDLVRQIIGKTAHPRPAATHASG